MALMSNRKGGTAFTRWTLPHSFGEREVDLRFHSFCCLFVIVLCGLLSGCESLNRSTMKNSEGVAHYTQGQYDQALSRFQEAIELDPKNAEAYYNVASSYQQQAILHQQPGLLAQAENYYRACLDRNPSPDTTVCCYRGIATSMSRRNQGEQAIALLRDWESRNQSSIEPKLEIAYLQESLDKNKEALETLKTAVVLAPNDYRPHYKIGVVQQKLGNSAEALNQYLMAGRLNPSDREIANRIALLQTNPDIQKAQEQLIANAQMSKTPPAPSLLPTGPSTWQSVNTPSENQEVPPVATTATENLSPLTIPKASSTIPTVSITPPSFTKEADSLPPTLPATSPLPTPAPSIPVSPMVSTSTLPPSSSLGTTNSLPDGTGAAPIITGIGAPAAIPVPVAGPPASFPTSPPIALPATPSLENVNPAVTPAPITPEVPTAAIPGVRRSRIGTVNGGPPTYRSGASL